jgi:hypothetical protein
MKPMDEVWLPLVDEPLGEVISRIQAEDTQITGLISSPRRQLAFRTFAYIRVGILLGELLLEREIDPDATGTWVDQLLEDPAVSAAVLKEVREVALEVVSDPRLASDEALGPDEAVRERFRDFVRRLETE